jgi:4-alpha-glucanotransferase
MPEHAVSFAPSRTYGQALDQAAEIWGIEREYFDIWGKKHLTSEDVKRTILESLGVSCISRESIDAAREARLWRDWSRVVPATLVISENTDPAEINIRIPAEVSSAEVSVEVSWESGFTERTRVALSGLRDAGRAELRGRSFLEKRLPLPTLRLGYHDLEVSVLGEPSEGLRGRLRLIVCPDEAYCTPALAAGGKAAGIAISLYGLRSERNWGCGDFTDLERFTDWFRDAIGGSFIAVNPLHAIPNRQPYNTSPYLPTSSFYRNYLYLDVERVPDFVASPHARCLLARDETQLELAALRAAQLVEYERVAALKLRFLKLCFLAFLRNEYRRDTGRAGEFNDYLAREGDLLDKFARFCALDEWIHKRHPDVWIWSQWPEQFRDPNSEATRRFAEQHWRSVLLYKYIQWQTELQLAGAHQHARQAGLSIGLYHDLALATDRYGSDLWAHREFYVGGCRVGAPPDSFAPDGQDWSFPPPDADRHRENGYRLFTESIRQNARYGGALRIDHVMRFFHLYWIPDEMNARQGAYVRDNYQDLLRILALESTRARFMVIGEDLGTVADQVREALQRFGILSYRLMYFEKDGKRFLPPQAYPRQALVSASTHDLPTLTGFWTARDIEARKMAGVLGNPNGYRDQLADRAKDKQRLLDVLFKLKLLPFWCPRSASDLPDFTGELHNAVVGFLVSTPSQLMVLNQEDLMKEVDQQNLPATTDQYPNWRRKMRFTIEQLRTDPQARDFSAMFRAWLERSGRLERAGTADPDPSK